MKEILPKLTHRDPYMLARARAILAVYYEKWHDTWQNYEILSVENEFAFNLMNPETESPSRSFDAGGKMDVLARYKPTGRIRVIEHKTTQDEVASDSDYWDRLSMDTQVSKYYLAASAMNIGEVESVVYDVISKPGQRPSKIPLLDGDGVKIVVDKAGVRQRTKDGKKWRESADSAQGWELRTRAETPAEFEARLLVVMRENPADFFAHREVPRLDSELLTYMFDAWSTTQQILYFRKHNLWNRNPDACKQMGTCQMFNICTGRASVDGIRYRKKPNVHAELKIQRGQTGKELLTASRTRAFNKCKQYHFLAYEEGIESLEVSEALDLGTLVHLGLEHYFKSMIKPNAQIKTA
jgi:hypothetical protein